MSYRHNFLVLCCPFSQLDVLDEIWDVTESVSKGFLTRSFKPMREGNPGWLLLAAVT